LKKLTGSAQWTIRDIDAIEAIAKKKPWKGMEALRQELEEPAERLGFELTPSKKRKTKR
jgi:hypothetical protein